jgi:glycosyltransferase involved in cell wall biosynthesis
LKLKRKYPDIKWIADFRDPWSEWDLLDTLSLTSLAKARHVKLEHQVLTMADRVITIAPYHVDRLKELGGRDVDLITNGFDAEDFAEMERIPNERFTIRHIGIVDELRNPRPVMEVIKKICDEHPDMSSLLKVEFIGNVNSNFKTYINSDPILSLVVSFQLQVPHSKLLKIYGQTDLQLLVLAHTAIAPGNLPGKLFEYLASGNQILAVGPIEGDAAQVLRKTKSGVIHEHKDAEGIQKSILHFYQAWRDRKNIPDRDVADYTRDKLTDKLISVLESLD